MDIFFAVMGYAVIGLWFIKRKPKGGIKGWHLVIGYTIFLPLLLTHAVIYLSGRFQKRRQP